MCDKKCNQEPEVSNLRKEVRGYDLILFQKFLLDAKSSEQFLEFFIINGYTLKSIFICLERYIKYLLCNLHESQSDEKIFQQYERLANKLKSMLKGLVGLVNQITDDNHRESLKDELTGYFYFLEFWQKEHVWESLNE